MIILAIVLLSLFFTLALCRAAGQYDRQTENFINNSKEKEIER